VAKHPAGVSADFLGDKDMEIFLFMIVSVSLAILIHSIMKEISKFIFWLAEVDEQSRAAEHPLHQTGAGTDKSVHTGGKTCPLCKGTGIHPKSIFGNGECTRCNGIGHVSY
jgi:hypothetical protein